MPIVTVQVTGEGTTPDRMSVTAEEKARINRRSEPDHARCSEQASRVDLCRYRGS